MTKITIYSVWLLSLLSSLGSYGQRRDILLDDLAYVLEGADNRAEVLAAMEQFSVHTQVGLAVTTLYEDDIYTTAARQTQAQWLQQDRVISVLIGVDARTKAFRQCHLQVSEAVEALLPLGERQQIQTGLLEFYFRSSPIPTNAYSAGLLAGIAAMEKKILERKEEGMDAEPEELPSLVKITDIDEEFSPGIAGYSGNELKVSYAMEKHETYDLKVAKFEVYNVEGKLVYNSEKEEGRVPIKEKGQFTWDGKMNVGQHSGQYISYNASPFRIKLIASTTALYENVFEADATAYVDEDTDKWNNFKFKDAVSNKSVWSYQAFKGLKDEYENSLKNISEEHPLDYLNRNLVPIKFLGRGPLILNIRFGYVLKLFEQSLSATKRAEYEQYLKTVSFDSKLRMTPLGNKVSNHAVGFALDLDAPENPMITDSYLYHFIAFVTGTENLYGRRDRTNAFIDELKLTHNTFVERLSLNSESPVTWNNLLTSAGKIETFENREPSTEASPLYLLADVANNAPLDDLETLRSSVEKWKEANIAEKRILEDCDIALNQLVWIETQVDSLQSVLTEYETGMLREHFVSTELATLKEYLAMTTEQITLNRTHIGVLKEYIALNDIQQLYQDFINYVDGLFEEGLQRPTFDKLSQVKNLNDHVVALYEGFKSLHNTLDTYKKYLEKIKGRVNQASSVTGKKLMTKGFFNLRSDFVKDWFAVDYSYWGGFYDDNHDFMHIEVVNSHKQRALERLHKQDLSFYKNFFKDHYPEEYAEMFKE